MLTVLLAAAVAATPAYPWLPARPISITQPRCEFHFNLSSTSDTPAPSPVLHIFDYCRQRSFELDRLTTPPSYPEAKPPSLVRDVRYRHTGNEKVPNEVNPFRGKRRNIWDEIQKSQRIEAIKDTYLPWHSVYQERAAWPVQFVLCDILWYRLIETPTVNSPYYVAEVEGLPSLKVRAKSVEELETAIAERYDAFLSSVQEKSEINTGYFDWQF